MSNSVDLGIWILNNFLPGANRQPEHRVSPSSHCPMSSYAHFISANWSTLRKALNEVVSRPSIPLPCVGFWTIDWHFLKAPASGSGLRAAHKTPGLFVWGTWELLLEKVCSVMSSLEPRHVSEIVSQIESIFLWTSPLTLHQGKIAFVINWAFPANPEMRMCNLFCAQWGIKIAKGGRESWDCLLCWVNRAELSAAKTEWELASN